MTQDQSDFATEDNRPSKSQRKREMLALQAIGEQLVNLPDKELTAIPMDADLAEAINTCRRIKSHEGRRRQMQYIGKLMRRIETDAIEQALAEIQAGRKREAKKFQALEQLRDQLIADTDTVLPQLFDDYPDIDRQHVRQLIRQAEKEKQGNKPPAASRKLFKYLREIAQ